MKMTKVYKNRDEEEEKRWNDEIWWFDTCVEQIRINRAQKYTTITAVNNKKPESAEYKKEYNYELILDLDIYKTKPFFRW